MKFENYFKQLSLLAVCLVGLASCNKYLDIEPKGKQTLVTVSDYDHWLNSTELESSVPVELNEFSDLKDNTVLMLPYSGATTLAYLWYPQFEPTVTSAPIIWGQHYKSIYYYNAVLSGINAATGGSEQQKTSLRAEALLGRALEYLYLVNEYGKPYDAATAATDLAVPFVISNDLATPTPSRSTVKQIYDRIIADINEAIPNLPANNEKNRYRGSKAAGYSVLARTYLFMRNYPEALKNAQLALSNGPNKIVDYNLGTSANLLGILIVRPDAIYSRIAVGFGNSETPKVEFLRMFDKNDIRLKTWYYPITDLTFGKRGVNSYIPSIGVYPNWGTGVAEMRLIIAEASARNNDLTTALQQLDLVRKNRIATAFYTAYSSANPGDVLQTVLKERLFEMPFNGIRWFDMRRLNAEGRMPVVTRQDALGATIATLAPGSPRYTLQIPLQVTYYNPDWPQNP